MFRWPDGFARIPDEEWTRAPVGTLAQKYDAVEKHTWYSNLDPTVVDLDRALPPGGIAIDYSGGTGILVARLLLRRARADFGVIDVDSSPKFLALALEKFRDDPRVAFRLIRFLKEEKRLQLLDEVLGEAMVRHGVDVVVSANAIHLYYDLEETLRSWARVLKPDGRILIQSGNIRGAGGSPDAWIIDDTVEAVHREAMAIARADPRFARFAPVLNEARRMGAYDALRQKFFLPARPLAFYKAALDAAGLRVREVRTRAISARTDEWFEFLAVYHEGILAWAGGSERVGDPKPTPETVELRLELMREALTRVLGGRERFEATWTYLSCGKV